MLSVLCFRRNKYL